MSNQIVPTQTAVPGVELIYLEDQDVAGIHVSGLARLLNCDPKTVANATETLNFNDTIETEIHTPQGIRTVKFILESGVIQVLKAIRHSSRIKKETKNNAEDLYDRFAVAGFKLYTMLKVAPEALKAKVDLHIEELEILRLKNRIAENEAIKAKAEQAVFDLRHYVVTALPETVQQKILGYTEVKTVEYRDRVLHNDQVIRNGETISKTEMCRRLGFISKAGSPNYKRLNHFLINAQVPQDAWTLTASIRENEELRIERWAEIERKFFDGDRDLFVGE